MTDLLKRIQNAKDTAPRGKRLRLVRVNTATFEANSAVFMSDEATALLVGANVHADDTLPDDSMEFVYEDAKPPAAVEYQSCVVHDNRVFRMDCGLVTSVARVDAAKHVVKSEADYLDDKTIRAIEAGLRLRRESVAALPNAHVVTPLDMSSPPETIY